MAFTNVYQKNIRGDLIQIGNTLGLSKASNALTPGTLGSIGAFITTQATTAAGGWPSGTTLNYTQNSSSSILTLPQNSKVVFASLLWSASNSVPGANVNANINDAITFIDALGGSHSLTGTQVSMTGIALSEGGESSTNYVKSVDVTTIVAAAGSGTYTTGSVPCTMSATSNFLQYAGWSLYVVYEDTALTMSPKNIVIFIGQTVSIDVPYSVPANYPGPPYPIKIFYTVGEGDAIITADQFNTRPGTGMPGAITIGTAVQPANSNPFASIIGNQNGGIDTTGSFGTANPSGTAATNISAGRQGWDIANNIDITSAFNGAAPNVGLDIGTNSDPAIMLANGFVVDLAQPVAALTKSVSKTTANIGDTLTYTLVYNFGTIPSGESASNIVVIDTVPNGVTYIPGSVTVNSVTQPNTVTPNPPGVSLATLSAKGVYTITYRATVNNVIQTTTIPNDAYASYSFTTNGTQFMNTNTSNAVLTTVDPFNASATKSVNKVFATIGDILTYTITIPNNGVTLNNVIFNDTIPTYTSFVPNSVAVNLVTVPGATTTNLALNTLSPNSFTTVSFSVLVTSQPAPNPIKNSATITLNYTLDPSVVNGQLRGINTNIVSTTINTAILSSTKQVNKNFANIGDILTYTIPITNSGNVSANNLVFIDTLPNGVSFVSGSLKQDGTAVSGSPNPPGATLPNSVLAGATSTVTFQVTITTIPSPNPINNSATTTCSYIVDFTTTPNITSTTSTNTNIVSTQVNNASLGGIIKSVNTEFATCGDVLTYTITLPNSGSTTAFNVILKDTIPNGTSLVSNSVTVNGVAQPVGTNPQSGVTVGTIPAGSSSVVTFQVTVNC